MGDIVLSLQRVKQLVNGAEVGYISLLLIIVLCISLYVYNNFKNAHIYELAAKLPGLPTLPLIGNAHYFIGIDTSGFADRLLELKGRIGGEPLKLWLGPSLWVGIFTPKDIEAVLTSENAVDKSFVYSHFSYQSDGIFVASGEKWRTLRKLVNPTFHMKLLEDFVQVFNEESVVLTRVLEKMADGKVFDIHDYIARCTLDMVCGTQMGVRTREQTENTSDFTNRVYRCTEIALMRVYKVHLSLDFIFNSTSYYKEVKKYSEIIQKFTGGVIKQRIEDRAKTTNVRGSKDYKFEIKKRPIFLDTMLDNYPEKSIEEFGDNLSDMLIAGSDTTGVAISFCLLMMAIHPEVQDRVYKEQCEIFSDPDSPVTMADLNDMQYLEMAIKETLRFCTVPGIARILTKDLKIENYTLPAGTNVYCGFYASHRDSRYWQYPDKFYPEHFTPISAVRRPKFSFVPFSMGPRNCPGYKYAMLSMKSVISHVIRKFSFTTPVKMGDIKYILSFMLIPATGYPLNLHRRTTFEPDRHQQHEMARKIS